MNNKSRLRSDWPCHYLRQGLGFGPFRQELNIMRKFVTVAATALTIGALGFATPAFADHANPNGGNYGQYQNNGQDYGPNGYSDRGYGDRGYGDRGYDNQRDGGRYDNDRRGDRGYDWNRHEGNLDRWERGWQRGGWQNDHRGNQLSHWQLVRRLERQGYYGVRGLRPARFGWGWKAFAFNYRGRPVMLRVNPYNGRVLDVRYV